MENVVRGHDCCDVVDIICILKQWTLCTDLLHSQQVILWGALFDPM